MIQNLILSLGHNDFETEAIRYQLLGLQKGKEPGNSKLGATYSFHLELLTGLDKYVNYKNLMPNLSRTNTPICGSLFLLWPPM